MALKKSQKSLKNWGKQKWKTKSGKKVIRYWRALFTRESDQGPDICGVCGNDKSKTPRNKKGQTVCETTQNNCKES